VGSQCGIEALPFWRREVWDCFWANSIDGEKIIRIISNWSPQTLLRMSESVWWVRTYVVSPVMSTLRDGRPRFLDFISARGQRFFSSLKRTDWLWGRARPPSTRGTLHRIWFLHCIEGLGSFKPLALYTPAFAGKSSGYPLNRRLGGPHSRSGRFEEEKNSFPNRKYTSEILRDCSEACRTSAITQDAGKVQMHCIVRDCMLRYCGARKSVTVTGPQITPLKTSVGGGGVRSVLHGGPQTFRDQNSLRVFSDWIPFIWCKTTFFKLLYLYSRSTLDL
jgi:hypothetical protein